MKKWLGRFLALIVVAALGALGLFYALWSLAVDPDRELPESERTAERIARGRQVAIAGDCVACHTAEGGYEFAGGRRFDTPFGTLYATNITPDPETGIGRFTAGQFAGALRNGASSFWEPLYPAMPYTSFHLVSQEDSDALYAYFMSLTPRKVSPPANELGFPFNIRFLMHGWNLLYASNAPYRDDPDRDAAWNRGAYLVRGLAHCGECHTPRNALGATIESQALQGGVVGDWQAPAIDPEALTADGWTRADMATFLGTGAAPQAVATSEMFLAVDHSFSRMPASDLAAMANYLFDGADPEPASPPDRPVANADAERLYLGHCAGCHGPEGQGVPDTFPPLAGNATLSDPDGHNLIRVIAQGLPATRLDASHALGAMPGFAEELTPDRMAVLANYLRARFATRTDLPALTAAQVQKVLDTSDP